MLQTGHSCEEHSAKHNVYGCPLFSGCHVEFGVFYPSNHFAETDSHDRNNSLENDKKDIQVAIDEMIIAIQNEESGSMSNLRTTDGSRECSPRNDSK